MTAGSLTLVPIGVTWVVVVAVVTPAIAATVRGVGYRFEPAGTQTS